MGDDTPEHPDTLGRKAYVLRLLCLGITGLTAFDCARERLPATDARRAIQGRRRAAENASNRERCSTRCARHRPDEIHVGALRAS